MNMGEAFNGCDKRDGKGTNKFRKDENDGRMDGSWSIYEHRGKANYWLFIGCLLGQLGGLGCSTTLRG